MTSGRAACTCEWMQNAASLTWKLPSTTSPLWLTRIRSDCRTCANGTPNGLTQNVSGSIGSRAVIWPATPSSKPNFANSRNPAASRCLRCSRSSSGEENSGIVGNHFSTMPGEYAAEPPRPPSASEGSVPVGAVVPLAHPTFRTQVVEPLAFGTDRELLRVAGRDPDLAAERDHRRAGDHRLHDLVLVGEVREPLVVSVVEAVVGATADIGVGLGEGAGVGIGGER